jgi:hypothetical protein
MSPLGLRLAVVLAHAGCAGRAKLTPIAEIERADRVGRGGTWQAALAALDHVAARTDASTADRVRALTGAAHACDQLGDPDGARRRLEQAITPEIPGVTEPAMYELAEHLRESDRARALSFYYRAAAGAEKHRAGGFPYRAAMDRILQISLSGN